MIIGLIGSSGAGKNTASAILAPQLHAIEIAFADPIKLFCKQLFGWHHHRLWGPSAERDVPDVDRNNLTARKALDTFGRAGRECYSDIWITTTLSRARSLEYGSKDPLGLWSREGKNYIHEFSSYLVEDPSNVIITDVRTYNEAKAIKGTLDSKLIYIHRNLPEVGGFAFEIEKARELADYTIANQGSLHELTLQVSKVGLDIYDRFCRGLG